MTIGELFDRFGEYTSARWQDFKLVFSEPILEWPLWAGIVVFLGLFLFWSMAISMARDELLNPTEEQMKPSKWDRPWTMVAASLISTAGAVWVFTSGDMPQILGVCFAFMAWVFLLRASVPASSSPLAS